MFERQRRLEATAQKQILIDALARKAGEDACLVLKEPKDISLLFNLSHGVCLTTHPDGEGGKIGELLSIGARTNLNKVELKATRIIDESRKEITINRYKDKEKFEVRYYLVEK